MYLEASQEKFVFNRLTLHFLWREVFTEALIDIVSLYFLRLLSEFH